MDVNQSQNFDERLNRWVTGQGFGFQLKYSMSGGGGLPAAMFHTMRMGFRVLLLLALAACGFAYFHSKKLNSNGFVDEITEGFTEGAAAADAEISGFNRSGGELKVRRLGATGTGKSFFETLEAGNLVCKMGLVENLRGEWDAGTIRASWVDVRIKAGANSVAEAAAAADSFFNPHPGFDFDGIESASTRVVWGYGARAGAIEGSRMVMGRNGGGWRMIFTGGTFSQNWMRKFEIEELVVNSSRDGVVVESGRLRTGAGRVDFDGVRVEGGELPKVSGRLLLTNVSVERMVPARAAEFLGGTISGELQLGGSTNSTEGVSYVGRLTVGEGDQFQLRDSIHLFQALDVLDVFNDYERVDFNHGSFEIRTSAGELTVSELNLTAADLMSLEGRMNIRKLTSEEAAKDLGGEADDFQISMLGAVEEEDSAINLTDLKGATKAVSEADQVAAPQDGVSEDPEKDLYFARLARQREAEQLQREASARAVTRTLFEGAFRVSIPQRAFERWPRLSEKFPADPETERITLEVPISGSLGELTADQAAELLKLGSERR